MTTTSGEPSAQLADGLARQNSTGLGRLLGSGGVGTAEEGPDGKMTATIRIPEDELCFEPGTLILPHGGDVELTLINDDKNTHCAVLPNNGIQVHLVGEPRQGDSPAQPGRPGHLLLQLHDR